MAYRRQVGDRVHASGVDGHLPAEAAEALLELATGGKPRALTAIAREAPFEQFDAHIEDFEAPLGDLWARAKRRSPSKPKSATFV